jgi:hypothetical protein
MAQYIFTVLITGEGDTEDEAWDNARDAVAEDGLYHYESAILEDE